MLLNNITGVAIFQIVRGLNLELQVAMSFDAYGGNVDNDVHIPLPQWVMKVGYRNPDIFFTDRDGRQNHDCLSWGIDKKWVLRGRTALKMTTEHSSDDDFDPTFNIDDLTAGGPSKNQLGELCDSSIAPIKSCSQLRTIEDSQSYSSDNGDEAESSSVQSGHGHDGPSRDVASQPEPTTSCNGEDLGAPGWSASQP